jgi:hypothetical protein
MLECWSSVERYWCVAYRRWTDDKKKPAFILDMLICSFEEIQTRTKLQIKLLIRRHNIYFPSYQLVTRLQQYSAGTLILKTPFLRELFVEFSFLLSSAFTHITLWIIWPTKFLKKQFLPSLIWYIVQSKIKRTAIPFRLLFLRFILSLSLSLSLYHRTYVSFLGFLSISLRIVLELVAMLPIKADAEAP